MDIFLEVKCIVRILYFTVSFLASLGVEAVTFDCIKSDVCSCKTNSKPQQEMSLWTIPSHNGIVQSTGSLFYDINLCHGLNKNTNVPDGGCKNSTVCQYDKRNKTNTFEIGHFGNVIFGKYNNKTKMITLMYSGIPQQQVTRSITITLNCTEDGNVTDATYSYVQPNIFNPNEFKIMITTKAACLRPVVVPKPTSRDYDVTSDGGLKTVYIILITVAGIVIVLALGFYVAHKKVVRRKKGLLDEEEEENEDYGTLPRVHVQNALTTPISGPV